MVIVLKTPEFVSIVKSAFANAATASENTIVSVAVWPIVREVSLITIEVTVGNKVSTVNAEVAPVPPALPAASV